MNYENNEVVIEGLESSMNTWILSDENDVRDTFGEDLVSAVKEALDEQ
jgi:hypothetical protein